MWYMSNRAGTELQKVQYVIRCFGLSAMPRDQLSHTVFQTWLDRIWKAKRLTIEEFHKQMSVFAMINTIDIHFEEDEDMIRKRLEHEWKNFHKTPNVLLLGLVGMWEKLKELNEELSAARVHKTWKEMIDRMCTTPLAVHTKLEKILFMTEVLTYPWNEVIIKDVF